MVVENAIKIIEKLKGVLDVQKLSEEDKENLLEIESGRKGDIIPVINRGLEECMKKDFYLVVLKNEEFRSPPIPTVLLVTDKGRTLGQELISPQEKEKYQNRKDAYFLSPEFVIFKPDETTRSIQKEKEFFILPSVPFPELDNLEEVIDVVSCSPSTMGDSYLKDKYGYPQDPHIATILVGFSVSVNDKKN
ncbi:hypothetical protein [Methanobacterium sp.]|uniref:hypothetical protein n=1 Tax=Methanobacterium sp. TaxID=2164 RepID=UPI003C7073FB